MMQEGMLHWRQDCFLSSKIERPSIRKLMAK